MSNINRDPDGKPGFTPELIDAAQAMGWIIVHVICDIPNAKVGDMGAVDFNAVMPAIPRVGEKIDLENKKQCIVKDVIYKVVNQNNVVSLIPNVYAVLYKDPLQTK